MSSASSRTRRPPAGTRLPLDERHEHVIGAGTFPGDPPAVADGGAGELVRQGQPPRGLRRVEERLLRRPTIALEALPGDHVELRATLLGR
jgi:hypothetical protein